MLDCASGCWHKLSGIPLGKEDCLYLNVHVPDVGKNKELLPVMVFIPGGGYVTWDISQNKMEPGHLLDRDVILVTVEYRLHILGFLTLGADGLSGNQALFDQRLALEWVQRNIKSFGGNPENVALFGQSAGAQFN